MKSVVLLVIGAVGCSSSAAGTKPVATKAELGEQLFFDPNLSEPAGQSCADCHDAKTAFVDPEFERVSPGVLRDRVGTRNAQSALYAAFVPPLHEDENGNYAGGLFWDGRASTLEDQAALPLLNPLEMNNPDKATVVAKVKKAYAPQFKKLFGKDAFADTERAYRYITEAIAEFERTPQFAPFSSKYDRYLAGNAELTEDEARGLAIFEDPERGNCASCHAPPLFTNFAYANLGIPKFADNPFYTLPKELNPEGEAFVDHGLAKTTGDPADEGKFRVPSLRNAAKTGPYGHNGYAHRLDEFITAYELPRAPQAVSKQDVADVVAFLRTLTDE